MLERMVLDLAAEATARRGPGPPQPCEAELEAAQDIAMQARQCSLVSPFPPFRE